MTDAALYQTRLDQANAVGDAVRELGSAASKLLTAVFQAMLKTRAVSQVSTAQQEADKLRAYADSLYSTDPRYADDLYAAATRHEMAALAE